MFIGLDIQKSIGQDPMHQVLQLKVSKKFIKVSVFLQISVVTLFFLSVS